MASRIALLSSVLLLVALGPVSGQLVEVDGALGGLAFFEVSSSLPAQYVVQWYFNTDTLIALLNSGGTPLYFGQCRGRCELHNNGSLRLDNLTYADQGGYRLQITDSDTGSSSNTPYHLNVYGLLEHAPVLKINSTTPTELVAGTYLSLECDPGNQNVSSYTFFHDGTNICSNPHVCEGRYLYFQPITRNDSGNYICTIENPFSKNTSKALQLALLEPVSGVVITTNTSKLLWAGIDSVALTCSAQGSNVNYSWSLQGEPVPKNPPYYLSQTDSVLTISPVSTKDNGTFTCTAENKANSEISNGVNLTLGWFPEGNILCTADKINQSVHLGCSWPGGQPEANVTLKYQNITENGINSVTTSLNNVTPGSEFTCHGDQFERTSECAIKFELPQSPGHNNNDIVKVEEGGPVKLEVSLVTPGLAATFLWYHNSGQNPIPATRSATVQSTNFTSTLQILKATPEDNGTYECVATNFVGQQKFLFTLNVTKALIPPASPPTSSGKLDGGAIAGIVIGVLAGITLIGILAFFLVKRNKRKGRSTGINEVEVSTGNAEYAVVNKQKNKQNGGVAETTMTTPKPQEDSGDVKYAELNFQKQTSAKAPNTTPKETEYSEVKISTNS